MNNKLVDKNIVFIANLIILLFIIIKIPTSMIGYGITAVILVWSYLRIYNNKTLSATYFHVPFLICIDVICWMAMNYQNLIDFDNLSASIKGIVGNINYLYLCSIIFIHFISFHFCSGHKKMWYTGLMITLYGLALFPDLSFNFETLHFTGRSLSLAEVFVSLMCLWTLAAQTAAYQSSEQSGRIALSGYAILVCFLWILLLGPQYTSANFSIMNFMSRGTTILLIVILIICGAFTYSEKHPANSLGISTLGFLTMALNIIIFRILFDINNGWSWLVSFLFLAASMYENCQALCEEKAFGIGPIPFLSGELVLGYICSLMLKEDKWIPMLILLTFSILISSNSSKADKYKSQLLFWGNINLFLFLEALTWNWLSPAAILTGIQRFNLISYLLPSMLFLTSELILYILYIGQANEKPVPVSAMGTICASTAAILYFCCF